MSIDVKRLAEKAGLREYCAGYGDENAFLQAFANLVLERAAQACEEFNEGDDEEGHWRQPKTPKYFHCAAAIRNLKSPQDSETPTAQKS